MDSIITVTAAAANRKLITLERVKTLLSITVDTGDDVLEILRTGASQALTTEYGRQFARDTLSQQFRNVYREHCLVLGGGFPDPAATVNYCAISSVSENGTVLDPADYEIDSSAGLLYRLSSDARVCWDASKIVVVFTAGYILPDDGDGVTLPEDVQGAAFELIKGAKFSAPRDPALRSESILSGLYSYSLFDPRNAETAWPTTVTGPMEKYRNITVA